MQAPAQVCQLLLSCLYLLQHLQLVKSLLSRHHLLTHQQVDFNRRREKGVMKDSTRLPKMVGNGEEGLHRVGGLKKAAHLGTCGSGQRVHDCICKPLSSWPEVEGAIRSHRSGALHFRLHPVQLPAEALAQRLRLQLGEPLRLSHIPQNVQSQQGGYETNWAAWVHKWVRRHVVSMKTSPFGAYCDV